MNSLRHLLAFVLLLGAGISGAFGRLMDTNLLQVRSVLFPDGSVARVGVGTNTPIYVAWLQSEKNSFEGWRRLTGRDDFREVDAVAESAGALVVFGLDAAGQVWADRQNRADSEWEGWRPVGAMTGFTQINPMAGPDGQLVCLAMGDRQVWINEQRSPNGLWRNWKRLPNAAKLNAIASRVLPDKTLEARGITSRSGTWISRRTAAGAWTPWQSESSLLSGSSPRRAAPTLFYAGENGAMTIYPWLSTGNIFVKQPEVSLPHGYFLDKVGNNLAAVDVDGDGCSDIVTAYQYPETMMRLHVFLHGTDYQGGRGWFQGSSFDTANIDGRMAGGDFNGDGKGDIVIFYDAGEQAVLYQFLSTGTAFVLETNSVPNYPLSRVGENMAAVDVNGDGKTDIVTACQEADGSMRLHVFLEGKHFTGNEGWFHSDAFDLKRVSGRMVGGDFDGDGKGDILLMYDADNQLRLHRFLSTGHSFVESMVTIPNGYFLTQVGSRVAAGDVNGDGLADAVVAYQYPNGSMRLHVFFSGLVYGGAEGWDRMEQFDLKNVAGRFCVGPWRLDAAASLPSSGSK